MKETLEKLWNEYLLDECAIIDTEEEKNLTKMTAALHEKANALLNKEQQAVIEKYVDSLCELESIFAKKAFFKGCEFSVSFLLETIRREKETYIHRNNVFDISK